MLDRHDDALLQRALDRDLAQEERNHLVDRLATDAALRERAASLNELSRMLEELNDVEPPAGMVEGIMARLTMPKGDLLNARRPRSANGGSVMAKRIMLGLAAAAAIVLAVFAIRGYPPVDNAQATVGAAKRYQAPQMADADVKLGDTSAQEFFQSDTFARLIQDPAAVKLLTDADFIKAVADPQIRALVGDQEFIAHVRNGDLSAFASLLTDEAGFELVLSIARHGLARVLADPHVLALFQVKAIKEALAEPDVPLAISRSAVTAALAKAELAACRGGCSDLVKAGLRDATLLKAIQAPQVVAALQNRQMVALLDDSALVSFLSKANVQAALANGLIRNMVADGRLVGALNSELFARVLLSKEFNAAVASQNFAQELSSRLATP